ncbi:hypothetical protein FRC10_003629 [Ceratobasidium sp. 414]|nr:hypothetical protein FRC10_003629 [Ceratobasidium sp. 414]
MHHAEDAQPSESVYGRPKRVLPFVKNTSRGRGQGRGRGNGINPGGGRGQAAGRGLSRGTTLAPGISRAGLAQPSATPSSSDCPLSSEPQPAWVSKSESTGTTSAIATAAPSGAPATDRLATQPRRRKFRPKMRDRPQADKSSASGTGALKHPLNEQLDSNANTLLYAADPPAKRRRVDEALVTASNSTPAPGINTVKLEEPGESLPNPSLDQVTTGTKFIGYDKYPKCHFGCGRSAKEVLNNRRSVKGQGVRDLQKQGLVVGAVFIRDDGIAIDWSLPPGSRVNEPIPSAETPVPQPGISHVGPSLALSSQHHGTPPPSSESPPPHPDPPATSAHAPPAHRPTTPTPTEIACREVLIPPRCLPLRGDTQKLEIWVVEQMQLLEAEIGPALVLQPELLGIGEYLTGQCVPSNVTPRVRLRYERPTRIVSEGQPDTVQTTSRDVASISRNPDQPQASTTNPTSPNHPMHAGPPIAHLPQSPSPGPRDHNTPTIKAEHDELAFDPPSPCPIPHPVLPDASSAEVARSPPSLSLDHSARACLSGSPLDGRGTLLGSESPCPEPIPASAAEMEEIQQLRRDLEASRLEAERKHRSLEQRILELSRKHLEAGVLQAETPAIVPKANMDSPVRIVDESKSKLLVLRRGKHDKTRRLFAPSQFMMLHVSWLGVLQLMDQNTRQIVATGFEEGAPDAESVEDACLLSESSVALAFAGNGCQLGVATLGGKNFKYLPLSGQPHEAKGICAVVPVNSSEVVTLGYNHGYAHWRFDRGTCSTAPLPIPKLHQCTALAYEPVANNIITSGSDSGKRSKLGVYSLLDSQSIPTIVDLSNHVHRIHTDAESPSLLILEVT